MREILQDTKYINIKRNSDKTFIDAVDRITPIINRKGFGDDYKSFTFTGCETNTGTTTIVVNLAYSLSIFNWKVLLVDCDLNKQKVDLGLADYLLNQAEIRDIIYDTNTKYLHYVPCGKNPINSANLFNLPTFSKFFTEMNTIYDFIFFDTPSINTSVEADIISPYTDAVVLIAKLNSTTFEQVKISKNKLKISGGNLIGIILNKAPRKNNKLWLKRLS